MDVLNKIVYSDSETGNGVRSNPAKIVPFASGENVKAISFMKYEYLKLVHNVLLML
jgi:hypothetical protein